MPWQRVATYVAIDKPEYVFELEEMRSGEDQMIFAHIRVNTWSHAVLKQMLADFRLFREHVSCPLYATAEHDDAKWESFISFFGFKFLQNVICENGEERRLFVNLPTLKESNKNGIGPVLTGHEQEPDH